MHLRSSIILALLFGIVLDAGGEEKLAVLPAKISLSGPQATHRVLVLKVTDGEFAGRPAGEITLTSSNDEIARVDGDVVVPIANGKTTITATAAGMSASSEVEVVDVSKPVERSFRNHVLPVLAKTGCNSGACHGALAGKGGFKLSLRGYDPETDFRTIVHQARGRRIELADPGRSLLLAKPSGAIPHKGGLRFEAGSVNYQVLADWISSGAKPPRDNDPRLEQLEVLPPTSLLQPGDKQQVLVRAHYSNGRVEDVTRWAKYASANESVAKIDENGLINVIGNGEGAITAWFSQKIVIARVTSPYGNQIPEDVFANAPRRNFIDELVLSQLKRLNLKPSPRCRDEVFIRRAFVDTIGTLPTADEVQEFLADKSSEKRDKLIEDLLSRPEFVDYWTYKWSDILMINGTLLRPEAVKAYYMWVRKHVEANTPWDHFVREIVTAQGSSFENGATNFYALHQDPQSMTENVSQAFLGLSIGCAKCHNHPLEKWTNNQYYAMANMFARVKTKGWGGDSRNGDGLRTLYVSTSGDLIQPLTGKPQPPTPLDGEPIPIESTNDRRVHLAKWLTSAANPYFARSITNRIWANFYGVGLVEQVDDMRASNPASNEALLAATAAFLVENKFDLKQSMRVILQSETYQRSSQPLPENRDEKRFYSRYYPRRMMAEVLLDAISQVTDVPSVFNEIEFPGADKKKTDFYPKGTRALQLYDSAVSSYFLKTFGRNQRRITCECERSDEPSMVQVLHISNGTTINDKLAAKDNRVDKLLRSNMSNEALIDEAYLTCLARRPTPEEKAALLAQMAEVDEKEKRIVAEDLFWAVMSSREFLFNH